MSQESEQRVIEQARRAALAEAGRSGWYPERVVDAAVRVVLEHLRAIAAEGGNLDDGLWYRRLTDLLETCS